MNLPTAPPVGGEKAPLLTGYIVQVTEEENPKGKKQNVPAQSDNLYDRNHRFH